MCVLCTVCVLYTNSCAALVLGPSPLFCSLVVAVWLPLEFNKVLSTLLRLFCPLFWLQPTGTYSVQENMTITTKISIEKDSHLTEKINTKSCVKRVSKQDAPECLPTGFRSSTCHDSQFSSYCECSWPHLLTNYWQNVISSLWDNMRVHTHTFIDTSVTFSCTGMVLVLDVSLPRGTNKPLLKYSLRIPFSPSSLSIYSQVEVELLNHTTVLYTERTLGL